MFCCYHQSFISAFTCTVCHQGFRCFSFFSCEDERRRRRTTTKKKRKTRNTSILTRIERGWRDKQKQQTKMYLSKFEQLPDEILLEICIYLKPYDIIYSFGQLNTRLNQTISQYRRDADLHHLTFKQFSHWFHCLLNLTADSIQNLVLSNWNSPGQICLFNQLTKAYSSLSNLFPRIRQLRLIDFTNHDIDILSKLDHIERIFIDTDALIPLKYSTHILFDKYLFCSKNSFKEIRLWGIEGGIRLQHDESLSLNSNLEKLTISAASIDDMILLFKRSPNLTHLNIEIVQHSMSQPKQNATSDILPKYLKFFHFQTTDQHVLSFEDLDKLVTNLPNLEFLSLDMDTNDWDYTDGFRWQNMHSTMANFQLIYFKLRIAFNSNLDCFNEEQLLQSFRSINIPICCYADTKILHMDTIPYDMTKFETNMSVTVSPNARLAKSTHENLLNQLSKRVQTLIIDGQHEATSVYDYLSVIEKFSGIEILQVNAININENPYTISSQYQHFRLPNLGYLHYIRSTRCKVHMPFFTFLTEDPIVTPKLKALSIMYGDLVYLCKRLPVCKMDRIKELWLYAGDADGHIVVKDMSLLLESFPCLYHFFFNHQTSRLIDRHLKTIIEMTLSSMQTLISFRISCNKGSLKFLHEMSQDTCELWIQRICNLNSRDDVHVTFNKKMLAIWK